VSDEELMALAVEQAWKGVRSGNGEVGVVMARRGEPVYRGFNRINASNDVTGHAEIDALRAVSEGMETLDLSDCTLYCTLEPCGMCTCACIWARVGRIVFGAGRDSVSERYFELDGISSAELLAHARVALDVRGGVLTTQCLQLYRRDA
jgi:tRNA(adenine34) deaminase